MYQALYRKYRPLTFDDVVSQEHVTRTLQNQLISGKTAHAYLFTGSRGTGKTTCARIFAKAINCEHPINGNPCLECDICKDADAGALSDIIEIDAASNNGVDDVRDIRDGAVYTPERCKFKIYIIDEVHMLSKEAFNALLKIMEEPPPHVKFILATTEIHKVLPTILSRCQRFDFHRINPADIKKRLLYVAQNEDTSLSDDAAELIAKTADGGMRDALSLLDQCIAFNKNVTADVVADAAGIAGRDYLFEIISAAADHNPAGAVDVIRRLYELSKDMQKLCDELITQYRNVMLAKTVPDNTDILVCMPNEIETIRGLASKMTLEEIFGHLDILQQCSERMPRVTSKRVEIEMCMIKLCAASGASTAKTAGAIDNSEIYAKIEMLEQKLSGGAASAPQAEFRAEPKPTAKPAPVQQGDVSKMKLEDFKPVEQWAEILDEFSQTCPPVSGALQGSYATENQDVMLIYTENPFFITLLRNPENFEKLRGAITKITGRIYRIKAMRTAGSGGQADSSPLQGLLKKARDNNITVENQ